MKKVITISITFLYLVIASGVFMNFHYCGGDLKHISFLHVGNEDDCCGSEEESAGCCKDKFTYFKVKDDHQSSDILKIAPDPVKIINGFLPDISIGYNYEFIPIEQNYHDPPVLYDSPKYLKHKVLII